MYQMVLWYLGVRHVLDGFTIGGRFKNTDNVIEEITPDGERRVRFRPVSAFETPDMVEKLYNQFLCEVDRGEVDPLLLIPMFVLDFLCIHPFNDGNGRMSRLLTLLLLYRAGYIVGKYISIEMQIEKTKDTYYDALQASSVGWHEGTNDCFNGPLHSGMMKQLQSRKIPTGNIRSL